MVALMNRLATPSDRVSEFPAWYDATGTDDERMHRYAEHE
jgi:hypothetical protein